MYRCYFTCFRVFMVTIVISETLRNILVEGNLFDGGLKFHMIKKNNIKLQTIQMYITVLSIYNEPFIFFSLFRLQVRLLRIWTTVPQMSFSIIWTSMSEYLQMRQQNMQSYHWVLRINIVHVQGYLKKIYDICHNNCE